MSPLTSALILLLAAPAWGRAFVVASPAGVRLQSADPTSCEDGDVCIQRLRVESRYGIRIEAAPPTFFQAAPIVIEKSYLVRDAAGAEYRFWIHDVTDDRVAVEIVPVKDAPTPSDSTGLAGTYKVVRVRIDGQDSEAHYPDLRLDAGGAYHLGSTTGAWLTTGRNVSLSGYFGSWGEAVPDANGTLKFQFKRAGLDYQIELSKTQVQAASNDSASRTPGS